MPAPSIEATPIAVAVGTPRRRCSWVTVGS
jgi:hypothetical protein